MVNETGTFFDGIGYNYEMLNERTRSNNKMTLDTHFRKKPKRLPSYIKLERQIDDDNSEDSTSTADSSESGVGSSSSCSPKSRLKLPKKLVANCLRKVAKSVCGGVDGDDGDGDDDDHARRGDQSQNHENNGESVINNTCGDGANITETSADITTESSTETSPETSTEASTELSTEGSIVGDNSTIGNSRTTTAQ